MKKQIKKWPGLPPLECPICESPAADSLFHMKNADIVECRHCSMIYVPTPAPEFTAIYKKDYFNQNPAGHGYHNYRSEFTSHLVTFANRLAESEKILQGRKGRLLDIGCALGHMGEAARRRGWDVYVTDVSEYAAQEARKQFGLNAFVSPPEKLPVKPERFEMITMYDIVEHLSHPLELLTDVRRALTQNGILHITTPNAHSLSAKLMGRHWYHIKPDEHLLYFTPETIRSVLERSGFEVIKIKPMPVFMRLSDIFLRLERYWKWGAGLARRLVRAIGLGDLRLKIYTGEMQVWAQAARLRVVEQAPTEAVLPLEREQFKDILDIVCCAHCRSEIQLFEDNEAICTQCELSYEVNEGVINFSKYAKRGKQKLVGSS